MLAGDATHQMPPDLPSALLKERIIYLVCICAMYYVLDTKHLYCARMHTHLSVPYVVSTSAGSS
jgi:hypothetical protein